MHSQLAPGVLSVADAEEDLVALVTLHVLEILHEDAFGAGEMAFDGREACALLI